jgi:hypothetical protein
LYSSSIGTERTLPSPKTGYSTNALAAAAAASSGTVTILGATV